MAQLLTKNLTLGYGGAIVAENINFSLSKGEYLCILGENGSGKSTLVKTLLGLLPPVSGTVEFSDGLSKNEIGYLPQQTTAQRDFPASVWEVTLSGFAGKMGLNPFYTKNQKEKAKENLEKMGISHLSKKSYRLLSGGQQQRVLLARALCAADRLLLLDEPTAGLDPKVSAEMYSLISRLNKEDKMSIIMVSHDVNSAVKYATHILHIGKDIFFGTKEQYLESPIGALYTKLQGGEM